jgi:hypothetical protein
VIQDQPPDEAARRRAKRWADFPTVAGGGDKSRSDVSSLSSLVVMVVVPPHCSCHPPHRCRPSSPLLSSLVLVIVLVIHGLCPPPAVGRPSGFCHLCRALLGLSSRLPPHFLTPFLVFLVMSGAPLVAFISAHCGSGIVLVVLVFFFFNHQFITRGSLAVRGRHIQTQSTLRLCYAVPVMYYQNLGTSFWRANAGQSPRIFQENDALSSSEKVETPQPGLRTQ